MTETLSILEGLIQRVSRYKQEIKSSPTLKEMAENFMFCGDDLCFSYIQHGGSEEIDEFNTLLKEWYDSLLPEEILFLKNEKSETSEMTGHENLIPLKIYEERMAGWKAPDINRFLKIFHEEIGQENIAGDISIIPEFDNHDHGYCSNWSVYSDLNEYIDNLSVKDMLYMQWKYPQYIWRTK